MTAFDPKPVTLHGNAVRLEPLHQRHFDGLQKASAHSSIWTWLLGVDGTKPDVFRNDFDEALASAKAGTTVPFAIIDYASNEVVGTTRYMDIRREHWGMEIGWTWLTPSAQRTAINSEAKLLLLEHAFEKLRALRIQLKTDAQNLRSQTAIARIGATREGVLRSHMICADGRVRDTVMFSILLSEWPSVKKALVTKISSYPHKALA